MPADALAGYSIEYLDRSDMALSGEFRPLDGDGPAFRIRKLAGRQSTIAVLDAGCGTGRQLHDLFDYANDLFGIDSSRLQGTAVSDHDFSQFSEDYRVRNAYATGRLVYMVCDLTVDPLPADTYDVAYSLEVMPHTDDPGAIVSNVWQALRPGGAYYFNALQQQADVLAPSLETVSAAGGRVLDMASRTPVGADLQSRMSGVSFDPRQAYLLEKPAD